MIIFKIPIPAMEQRELHRDSYPDGRVRLKLFDPNPRGEPRWDGYLTQEARFSPLCELGVDYAIISCGDAFLTYLTENKFVEFIRNIDEASPYVNMSLVRVLI